MQTEHQSNRNSMVQFTIVFNDNFCRPGRRISGKSGFAGTTPIMSIRMTTRRTTTSSTPGLVKMPSATGTCSSSCYTRAPPTRSLWSLSSTMGATMAPWTSATATPWPILIHPWRSRLLCSGVSQWRQHCLNVEHIHWSHAKLTTSTADR
jgi:hypothetical protein